jgi:hypothetical protein
MRSPNPWYYHPPLNPPAPPSVQRFGSGEQDAAPWVKDSSGWHRSGVTQAPAPEHRTTIDNVDRRPPPVNDLEIRGESHSGPNSIDDN